MGIDVRKVNIAGNISTVSKNLSQLLATSKSLEDERNTRLGQIVINSPEASPPLGHVYSVLVEDFGVPVNPKKFLDSVRESYKRSQFEDIEMSMSTRIAPGMLVVAVDNFLLLTPGYNSNQRERITYLCYGFDLRHFDMMPEELKRKQRTKFYGGND